MHEEDQSIEENYLEISEAISKNDQSNLRMNSG